jgi:hypothetical protein
VSTSFLNTALTSTIIGFSNVGVTQIIAGTNVTISPGGGQGQVTVNASGGGGGAVISTFPDIYVKNTIYTSSIFVSDLVFTDNLAAFRTYVSSIGVNNFEPSFPLDVNGIARSGIPVSSITDTSADFGLTGFGISYYITDASFSGITLPTTDPESGWFITLRNNTGGTLSITISGTNSKIPASPFTIAPDNSVSLAYDANPPTAPRPGCNWVYL